MDKKLQEFAERAGLKTEVWFWGSSTPTTVYKENTHNTGGLEKFAEMVIRECAAVCEANGESYKHSFTPSKAKLAESTSKHCANLIKKHFGVE